MPATNLLNKMPDWHRGRAHVAKLLALPTLDAWGRETLHFWLNQNALQLRMALRMHLRSDVSPHVEFWDAKHHAHRYPAPLTPLAANEEWVGRERCA
jgi:hypothetical protein